MGLKFTNLASTTLSGGITNADNQVIAVVDGSKFPALAAGDYAFLTLMNAANVVEFILITARAGNNLTIPVGGRARGGSTALAWNSGDRVELRPMDEMLQCLQAEAGTAIVAAGTDTYTATPSPALIAYNQYQSFLVHVATTNTVTVPTLNLSGLGAKNIVRLDGQPLNVGDIPVEAMFRYDGTSMILLNPVYPRYAPGTMFHWPVASPPPFAVHRNGAALTRTTYPNLHAVLAPTRSGVLNGTAIVTGLSSTTDMYVGMPVEGANIPAATTVASIQSNSQMTMSAAATGSGTVPIRLYFYGYGAGGDATKFGVPDDRGLFDRGLDTAGTYDQSVMAGTTANGVATITGLSSTVGMFVGMGVSGANIPGGRTIASIDSASQVTMSGNATGVAVTITFAGRQVGNAQADDIRSHTHVYSPNSFLLNGNPGGSTGWFWNQTTSNTGATGNAETRPRNRAYLPIICF